jgi:ABC-type siderophore export system fused ATPase/permease subunit
LSLAKDFPHPEPPQVPHRRLGIVLSHLQRGRARRRAALERAWKQIVVFTLIGAVFPLAQALGFTWQNAQPLVLAGTVLAFAYLFAALTIQGPGPLLARSRAMLRRV